MNNEEILMKKLENLQKSNLELLKKNQLLRQEVNELFSVIDIQAEYIKKIEIKNTIDPDILLTIV